MYDFLPRVGRDAKFYRCYDKVTAYALVNHAKYGRFLMRVGRLHDRYL